MSLIKEARVLLLLILTISKVPIHLLAQLEEMHPTLHPERLQQHRQALTHPAMASSFKRRHFTLNGVYAVM